MFSARLNIAAVNSVRWKQVHISEMQQF